jgi:4-hydroxybutyrate CoA-transferase
MAAQADWRRIYEERKTTPEAAARRISPGDTVNIPIFAPRSVMDALWARREELRDVRLQMNAVTHDPGWLKPGSEEAFSIDFEIFIGDFARPAHDERRGAYLPNLFSRSFKAFDERRPGVRMPNTALVVCSSPNQAGYVNFGPHHWTKRSLVRRSDLVIAEVDPTLVPVHGDVWVHVSEIDCFIETQPVEIGPIQIEEMLQKVQPDRRAAMAALVPRIPRDRMRLVFPLLPALEPGTVERLLGIGEPPESYKAIAGHLSEVIEDGDCLQIGVGEPSSLMVQLGAFDARRDLGVHTELVAPGTAQLVERGIVTGKRKNQFPGLVVAAAWTGASDADMEIIRDNPTFQLFDPEFVLDISRIAANDRQVSINNALSIDLIGQINAESVFGGRMINGTGGQPETHLGAFLSKGGKAITLLPSTALDGAVSRIVARHEPGSIITVPRFFADIVITEYGIARLLGKSHRERGLELIAVAHPDFRQELRKEYEQAV